MGMGVGIGLRSGVREMVGGLRLESEVELAGAMFRP